MPAGARARPKRTATPRRKNLDEASLRCEATMPEAWLELDTALKERLHDVLDDPQRPVTEASYGSSPRKVEPARSSSAESYSASSRAAELDRDPGSSLAIAGTFRRVHDFRAHLDELGGLLSRWRVVLARPERPGCWARRPRGPSAGSPSSL